VDSDRPAPPELPDSHPARRHLATFEAMFRVADLTADAFTPKLDGDESAQLAEVNGLLLAFGRLHRFDPSAGDDVEERAVEYVAHLAAGLRSLADLLEPIPGGLVRLRRQLIPVGAVDAAVPVIRPDQDFGDLQVCTCPGRPDGLAGVWSTLRPDHPARAFVDVADLAVVSHVGPCLILTEDRTRRAYFDLGPAVVLSRAWRADLDRYRQVRAEQEAFAAARAKERETAAGQPVEALKQQVEALRRQLAERAGV